jgi:predicted nucleotidyltransferase
MFENEKTYKIVPIIGTIMKSKEDKIIKLFYDNPTKEWHFEEIVKESGLARSKVSNWLNVFINKNLIKKIKKKGKMPFYISCYNSSDYKINKKLFALNQLYNSGLLVHLDSLKKAKTIIIFGSFVKSDWYKNSDLDLFIYGNSEGLNITKYEQKLNREIQLIHCNTKKELKKINNDLIKNIIKGNLIKGNLDFIEVEINA